MAPKFSFVYLVLTRLFVAIGLFVTSLEAGASAQTQNAAQLNRQVHVLIDAGRFQEALPLAQQAYETKRKSAGRPDIEFAIAAEHLGTILENVQHFSEAEQYYDAAISAYETIGGKKSAGVASALNGKGASQYHQYRYKEAESLYLESIEIASYANDKETLASAYSNIGILYKDLGRLAEARQAIQHSISIRQALHGADHPDLAISLIALSAVDSDTDDLVSAEKHIQRAIEIQRNSYGFDSLNAALYLGDLAGVYSAEGRTDESKKILYNVIDVVKKQLGENHDYIAEALKAIADIERDNANFDKAKQLYEDARRIKIAIMSDPDDIDLGLGLIALRQGRYEEAERINSNLLHKALAKKQYDDKQLMAIMANNLAEVYKAKKSYEQADPLYDHAVRLVRGMQGSEILLARFLNNWAELYRLQDKTTAAFPLDREAASIRIQQIARTKGTPLEDAGTTNDDAERLKRTFNGYILSSYAEFSKRREAKNIEDEAFKIAQWTSRSNTANVVARMAARFESENSELATLIRRYQDAVAQRLAANKQLANILALPASSIDARIEDEIRQRITSLDREAEETEAKIRSQKKDYADLAFFEPLSIEKTQRLLASDEILIQLNTQKDMTFVWALGAIGEPRWFSVPVGLDALKDDVQALRCGLDATLWRDATTLKTVAEQSQRCEALVGATPHIEFVGRDPVRRLPFDLARANALYKELFGPIEDLIANKKLLIVPSGPLTQLPFQVLVTEPPKMALTGSFAQYRNVAWLARRHAMTVLPSVSSLKALRELAKESHASEAYVGFGDPLLEGEPTRYPDDAVRAKLAREKRCDPTLRQRVASLVGLRGGTRAMTRSYGGTVDIADLRSWAPLPETADELCDVAHDLGVDPKTHLYLGAMATETKIKQLSENGALAKYKIVHFATHGAVAGQVSRASEPGLLLTPPEQASEMDDGYLSASEIASLKLDADWVILSACNTAAGGAQGAEALSGLARAFFYAGARSLLVSHWEVDSEATVKLITKAVDNLKTNPKIGRAEALRESMLAMIDSGQDVEAHPAFWAPFVLVGEGGAAR
jgi:CHAT domain-containing protein/tetratricopeptide (TPR) repeat protein